MDAEEMCCSSPEMQGVVKIESVNSLPEQSKKTYLSAYETFIQWKRTKKIDFFSESLLMEYFTELSSKYKPSTLWTTYSMLRSTLNLNHGVNIECYSKLRAFLKRKSEGFRPKKASTFSAQNIEDFLANSPDDKYLATKVALIMGVVGECRANEMYEMKIAHLKDLDSAFLVELPKSRTKMGRKFIITGNNYEICKKYISLRPPDAISDVLFLNFQNGKCTNQRIGINKFTKMGKQIAQFLKLPDPENFSGHSFRKSSVAEAGVDITSSKRNTEWKSTTMAEDQIDESIKTEMETDEKFSTTIKNKNNETIVISAVPASSSYSTNTTNPMIVINIQDCVNTNVTINVNK